MILQVAVSTTPPKTQESLYNFYNYLSTPSSPVWGGGVSGTGWRCGGGCWRWRMVWRVVVMAVVAVAVLVKVNLNFKIEFWMKLEQILVSQTFDSMGFSVIMKRLKLQRCQRQNPHLASRSCSMLMPLLHNVECTVVCRLYLSPGMFYWSSEGNQGIRSLFFTFPYSLLTSRKVWGPVYETASFEFLR